MADLITVYKRRTGDLVNIEPGQFDGEVFTRTDPTDESGEGDEVEASKAARTLANEHGIDLSTIEGTGKEGKVRKPDVEAALEE